MTDLAPGLQAGIPAAEGVVGPVEPRRRGGHRSSRDRLSRLAWGWASIVLVGIVWWAVSAIVQNDNVLPTPAQVFGDLLANFTSEDPTGSTGWFHLGITLRRILISFLITMVTGTAIGLVMGMSKRFERLLVLPVSTGLAIPSLCWAILATMWFGVSELTALFAIWIVTLPFVVVSLWEGAKAVDRDLVGMAEAYKATTSEIVRRIYIPHLMPYLFGAFRYGFAMSWKIAVVVELFGVSSGVGYILQFWYQSYNMSQVIAWTLTFAIVIVTVEKGMIAPARRYIFRWQPTEARVEA
ncbi:MAG: transporter permease [Actinotalea sp.]|nr:transporter permease [Actinotalea sp.]